MCCSLSLLSNITKLSKPVSLSLPNGLVLLVKNISTSYLDNVFFVPSFNYNLLFVSKWISVTEGTISFYSDHCDFRASHSQDVLAHGRMISKLYHLEFYKDFSSTLFFYGKLSCFKTQTQCTLAHEIGTCFQSDVA